MTIEISGKAALQKCLTSLLKVGDDDADYVVDVLDQLLEIGDDVDDVASYLTSFLGDDDTDGNVMQFAADVKRFKLGEEIIMVNDVEPSPPEPNAELLQGNDTNSVTCRAIVSDIIVPRSTPTPQTHLGIS